MKTNTDLTKLFAYAARYERQIEKLRAQLVIRRGNSRGLARLLRLRSDCRKYIAELTLVTEQKSL